MFIINDPNPGGRNYENFYSFSSSVSDGRTINTAGTSGSEGYIQWGGTTKDRFLYGSSHDEILGADSYSLSWISQFGSDSLTGSVHVGITVREVWTNALLTVDAACNWTFEAEQLDIYVTIGGGSETLWKTITNLSDGGIDFAKDDNKQAWTNLTASISPAFPTGGGTVECAVGGIANEEEFVIDVITTIDLGYRISDLLGGWTHDAVEFKDSGQNALACDCSIDLPNVTYVDSYDVSATMALHYERQATLITPIVCNCPNGGSITNNGYRIDWDGYIKGCDLGSIIPSNAAIYDHVITRYAKCNSSESTEIITGTEPGPTTYGDLRQIINENFETDKYCSDSVLSTCVLDPGEDPPECPLPDDVTCFYSAYTLYQLVTPLCAAESRHPDNVHFVHTKEYVWAKEVDTDIWVFKSQFSIPVIGFTTGVKVTSTGTNTRPALFLDPRGIFYVSYEVGGNIVYRFSTDFCLTWSDEITLFTSCQQPRVAVGPNGERLYAAFKYDSGSSGPGKIRVVSRSAGGELTAEANALNTSGTAISFADDGFDISFSDDNHGAWTLIAYKDGETDVTIWASNDFGLTWIEVSP